MTAVRLLDHNFAQASPRRARVHTTAASLAIHGAVLTLWLALLVRAFWLDGIFAWSAGMAYVAYDTLLLAFAAWQCRALLRAPRPVPATGARLTLGVLIAAHNEAAVLPATLAALAAQTDRPDLVLVADDGSTDDTFAILRDAAATLPFPLRGRALPRGGKSRALNEVLLEASVDIILTVDADTLLAPDAIAAMRAAFAADPGLTAATGVLQPICGPGPGHRAFQWFQTYEYVRNFLSRFAWMRADGLLLISGAFAGFRRDHVIAVGGFDAECLVEDYELIHRLRRHSARHGLGWHTAVLGQALATTEAPGTIPAFLRQRRRWFGGFLQTQLWYRDMVGNPSYGRVGTWMLPVKAADTLQPLYGLTAIALLLFYLATGRLAILLPAGAIMAGKIAIDLGFQIWAVGLFRRWIGPRARVSAAHALAASLVEPFCFQPLRHAGAALGWLVFLTGSRTWGRQTRVALTVRPAGTLPAA